MKSVLPVPGLAPTTVIVLHSNPSQKASLNLGHALIRAGILPSLFCFHFN